jgi:hypothetical protein
MIPGVYFLVKCIKQDCSSFKKTSWIYIGMDGTYDVGQEKKYYHCAICGSEFKAIHNILFIKCFWKYRGKRIDGDIVESPEESQVIDNYSFKQEQNIAWDWLLITVRPLDNCEKRKTRNSGTQTEFEEISEDSFLIHSATVKIVEMLLNRLENLDQEITKHQKRRSYPDETALAKRVKREDA